MQWPVLTLALLLFSTPLAAEEKAEEAQEHEEKPVEVAQAKPNPQAGTSDADDYKASEEISEDLSVSYPVDI
ncbi:hypothetical protein [Microbulbifer magnicolonia]|uniref:hypothetical protein n=1 Tax=Microbulbifer magnicolonia TaxID=3109744 RepID=UPI002B405DA2|nr:hypothetical protein [Microbulbifer sp. GG15]